MDLGEIWSAHKRFLLGVGAGLVLVFVASRILASMYVRPALRLERSTRSMISKLRKRPSPTKRDLHDLEERNRDLDRRLGEAQERVRFVVAPEFLLHPGDDSDLVYNDRFRVVRDAVMKRAGVEGIAVDPSLGMPEATPSDRAEAQRILKALDLVREVLGHALDSGVDSIPEIRVPATRRRGFQAARSYLSEIRAAFEITGDADAVLGCVEALQTRGRFLTVDACRLEQLDPRKPGPVRVRMEVVGLEIDPDAPARPLDSGRGAGGGRRAAGERGARSARRAAPGRRR